MTSDTNRWYVRCTDCLAVGVLLEQPTHDLQCGTCGGKIESMGKVSFVNGIKHLTEEVHKCPCDARCTHAIGPQCDCPCGGANHGTGRVITVVHDLGVAPKCVMPEAEVRLQVANEYREAFQKLIGRLNALNVEYDRRRNLRQWPYLPDAEYSMLVTFRKLKVKIAKMRVHKARMKVLAGLGL